MTEDRINNLEIKLSFTEDLIDQLNQTIYKQQQHLIDQLNQTIYKQQQQIEFLYRELKSIKEQSSSGDGAGISSPKDEIPPHY
ncbi:MAG: hypothetical protein RL551_1345 [Pseudomonadota bacterium]